MGAYDGSLLRGFVMIKHTQSSEIKDLSNLDIQSYKIAKDVTGLRKLESSQCLEEILTECHRFQFGPEPDCTFQICGHDLRSCCLQI